MAPDDDIRVGMPFGVEGVRTLAEVADTLGCSPEHVRKIEKRALLKLRYLLEEAGRVPEDYYDE